MKLHEMISTLEAPSFVVLCAATSGDGVKLDDHIHGPECVAMALAIHREKMNFKSINMQLRKL
jgi:hypothetical protein